MAMLIMAAPALADEMVSAKLGYQFLSISGDFVGCNGGSGTKVDMESDIDFDDADNAIAEAALHLGDHRLSVSYMPLESSGSGNNADFDFNGVRYLGPVKGDLSLDLYEVAYAYYLLNFDDLPARVQIGLEGAIKYVDADVKVRDRYGIIGQESAQGSMPYPTIGARSRVAISDFVGAVARLGYSSFDDESLLDIEAQVEFSPLPLVGIYGGYRYLAIEMDDSDLKLDATFSGPFIGVLARF